MPTHSLPEEAKAVIWQIFGEGKSPFKDRPAYDLIEPIVMEQFAPVNAGQIISEVKGWFEESGDQYFLRSEMTEMVTSLVLEGIRGERSERAVWAAAWISYGDGEDEIRSNWSADEIDILIEAAIETVKRICYRDDILDASRCTTLTGQEAKNARISKGDFLGDGWLDTYRNIRHRLLHGLLRPIERLIALIVELRPERFESIISQWDHPVIQAWAAYYAMHTFRLRNHRITLEWIDDGACDALIGLSIVHTLRTVEYLDQDLGAEKRLPTEQVRWHTELCPPNDDLDSAASALIRDLVSRLGELDAPTCARWIGGLLNHAPSALRAKNKGEVPHRIQELEMACIALLKRLVNLSWSDDLITEFRAGFASSYETTWTKHLAALAWEVCDTAPNRATEIGRTILEIHGQHVAKELANDQMYIGWTHWESHAWIEGLGKALALSCDQVDLYQWVKTKCKALPLSAWDAEADISRFSAANRAAQHWFHVAFAAIPWCERLGSKIDPAKTNAMVETLWTHFHFVDRYTGNFSKSSVEIEFAARTAAEYGESSDTWLLKQARNPIVHPRALWALFHQLEKKRTRDSGIRVSSHYTEEVNREVARLAGERFGMGLQFNLAMLEWWSQLWLTLRATDLALHTVKAFLAYPWQFLDRQKKLLVLKLLALVISEKQDLDGDLAEYPTWLYHELWPDLYTAKEEREDRERIDAVLRKTRVDYP